MGELMCRNGVHARSLNPDPSTAENARPDPRTSGAGVDAESRDFEGPAHEFFGMADVVADAKEAQSFVAERLQKALGAN